MSDVMAANPQHYSMGGFSYGTLCNATASPVPPSQMGVCELFNQHNLVESYVFTFHYASTLSDSSFMQSFFQSHLHSTMLLLYLKGWPDHWNWKAYLHSTMLLLYLKQIDYISAVEQNLHSTMLLLYHRINQALWRKYLFTFHYASTLSL